MLHLIQFFTQGLKEAGGGTCIWVNMKGALSLIMPSSTGHSLPSISICTQAHCSIICPKL